MPDPTTTTIRYQRSRWRSLPAFAICAWLLTGPIRDEHDAHSHILQMIIGVQLLAPTLVEFVRWPSHTLRGDGIVARSLLRTRRVAWSDMRSVGLTGVRRPWRPRARATQVRVELTVGRRGRERSIVLPSPGVDPAIVAEAVAARARAAGIDLPVRPLDVDRSWRRALTPPVAGAFCVLMPVAVLVAFNLATAHIDPSVLNRYTNRQFRTDHYDATVRCTRALPTQAGAAITCPVEGYGVVRLLTFESRGGLSWRWSFDD